MMHCLKYCKSFILKSGEDATDDLKLQELGYFIY